MGFSVADLNDPVQLRRKLVLTPCSSKEGLRRWIRVYLGIDFPDQKVDEESTGSIMDTLWQVYHAGVTNDESAPSRYLWYASRDSGKCVEKGTKILSKDRGLVNIEDIGVGEVIWSGWAWRPITHWVHDGVKDGVSLLLEDGRSLVTSNVHRVWTWSAGGSPTWKKVSELDLDSDLVMVQDFDDGNYSSHKWVRPSGVKSVRADFYDLTVDEDHSYWSNGIVSHNTLGASVLELLAMLHMKRSVVHLASILQQSIKASEYYKGFLDREALSEFRVGDNQRTVSVVWFEHLPTGNILTLKEWKELGGRARAGEYRRFVHYIKIIVNSARSANSDHCAYLCVDEADLIQYVKAYREALMIPTTTKDENGNNQPPITFITSSRKSSGGLVQEEIDNAEERGTMVLHHNILDVTARCPDERHRPDLPKIKVFSSKDTLKTLLPDDFRSLQTSDPKKAETYTEDEAYWGCYHNCKIFAGCHGRLASQTCNATFLKPTSNAIRVFKEVGDVETVKAQIFCWKPGNSGAIYANFSRVANMLSMDEMWESVTGEKSTTPITKGLLIETFMARGHPAVGGMDFGYTHCFAVVIGFVVGKILYVVDAFEIPELEPHQCVEVCDRRIKFLNPMIWPDTAYPAYIKMFRSAGYRCREHKKDVIGGIEAVRKKILPAGLSPELFLIKGDDGCELLAKRIVAYKWKEDSIGRITDIPDDTEDDLNDACRYLVQNTFGKSSGIILAKGSIADIPDHLKNQPPHTPDQVMSAKIHELTGGEAGSTIGMPSAQYIDPNKRVIRKGGFFASFE